MNAYYKGRPIFGPRGPAGPDGNPIGTIISFMGHAAPTDYLICDGSVYNISDYSELAAFFREQFGSETYFGSNGDGTFAVPDMRNLFLRGYHGESEEELSGEIGEKQEGTHHQYDRSLGNVHVAQYNSAPSFYDVVDEDIPRSTTYANSHSTDYTIPTFYTSRPVNMAVLYCIKAVKSESEKRDDGEIYFTEETRIGTWIDGKPLYRKVIQEISPNAINKPMTVWSGSEMDSIVRMSGFIVDTDSYMAPINYINSIGNSSFSNYNVITILDPSKNIIMIVNNSIYVSRPVTIIIEYTKTTDNTTQSVSSEVSPKASGTITKDGKQYDYELPDIVSAASSAAITFDGIGSAANNI